MREGDRANREVITILTPQHTTPVVRLFKDAPVFRTPLDQIAKDGLDALGEERRRQLSSNTYSLMVKMETNLGFGTIFSVAPGIWLTCQHVVAPYNHYRVEIPSSNTHDFATWPTRQPLHLTERYMAYLHNLIRDDKDPLYNLARVNAEFTEYFDIALMSGPIVGNLMFPSTEPLNVGDKVAVFGYNGFPSMEALQRDFDLVFGNSPLKPTVPYASDIFHQIGSKGVSFGRILAIGPGVLAHNCSLLNGASGSFIVKIDDDRLTFVGVHIGGEFNQSTSTAYNYGYTTSHPGLILLYAKVIYPIFKARGGVPKPIVAYLEHHKTIIEQHQEFIHNDVLTMLASKKKKNKKGKKGKKSTTTLV